jgi:phosphocarrier protein HPr
VVLRDAARGPVLSHVAVAAILFGTENAGRRRGRRVGAAKGMALSRYRPVNSWSRAEWERLPVEARPEEAIPFGDGWVQLSVEPPIASLGATSESPASESAESRAEGLVAGGRENAEGDAVPTARRPVVILNALGLHLRPADLFVGLARRFSAEIKVHCDGRAVDGESVLDLVTLAAEGGTRLDLEARGPDAEAAVAALAELVAARFHEAGEAE